MWTTQRLVPVAELDWRSGKPQPLRRYFAFASCSASSSQALARRIISSRAGSPFGKRVCRSASRLMPPPPDEALVRPRTRVCSRARVMRRVVPLFEAPPLPVRRFDAPDTPCARLRWAPREAARVKVLPHSGQVSVAAPAAALAALDALSVLAMFLSSSLNVDRTLPPPTLTRYSADCGF